MLESSRGKLGTAIRNTLDEFVADAKAGPGARSSTSCRAGKAVPCGNLWAVAPGPDGLRTATRVESKVTPGRHV